MERPCYERNGPGKIKSFLKKKSQCHDSEAFLDGHYTTKRDDVDCGAKSAWVKVVANVTLNCPARATHWVSDIDHHPSTTCLRTL